MANNLGIIAYVSFGAGRHVDEILASIISALKFPSTRGGPIRIVVMTDDANPFFDLPIETVVIPPEQVKAWRGDQGYFFNVKIHALQNALKAFNVATAMIDGDTYFLRDPARLFARVGPGRTVMHLRESALGLLPNRAQLALRDAIQGHTYTTRRGDVLKLGDAMPVWNSGVCGCHPDDVGLIDDVLDLARQLHALSKAHITEQLAFSAVFDRYTRLSPAADVVFHYWSKSIRDPFAQKLPALLAASEKLPIDLRVKAIRAALPRYSLVYRLKRWFRNQVLVPLKVRQMVTPMS